MWNRFWNSFGQTNSATGGGEDTESAISGSHRPMSEGVGDIGSPSGAPSSNRFGSTADLSSDLHPNDSASAVGGTNMDDGASGVGFGRQLEKEAAAVAEVDDGTYLFKFVTPSGRTHRFQARYDSYETIKEIICIKLSGDPFFDSPTLPTPQPQPTTNGEEAEPSSTSSPSTSNQVIADPNDFNLAYTDDDDDLVLITADGDVNDAVKVARKQGKDRVVVLLQGGRTWEEVSARNQTELSNAQISLNNQNANKKKQRDAVEAQLQSVKEEEEKDDEALVGGDEAMKSLARKHKRSVSEANGNSKKKEEELIMGVIPKDLALPAAIGFLGVAVLVGVLATRGGGGGSARY